MVPKIKKILYATDLSPNSAYAFRYAISSAKMHDANIVILHVVEPIPSSMQAILGAYMPVGIERKILEEKKNQKINQLEERIMFFSEQELENDLEGADRVQSIEVCEGYPEAEILIKADEFNCDAIVMGTHGKGLLKHAFFGNTARKVLRRSRKPVLIIPLPEGETDITFHDKE
jgi:nucleotide-binding universal stress UspA family protein